MKVRISLRTDSGAEHKINLINSLIDSLEVYFASKNYGSDIEDILIGLTCAYVSEGFEHLFKMYPTKYVDFKIIKNKYTGESIELNKHFHYSVKLDNEEYNSFINESDEESRKILAVMIIKSLSNLDGLPKKVKNFDKERFKNDTLSFFEKEVLI
ncbi:hypothetical protein C8C83_0893 [Flavobacterium sp. 90]|uniref:hypothetical protein n=1 Tax=unclassified Flavobacterium TaxID=196869 RepID=UPI000EB020CE|nr:MULTISPECIES: hypothetical protein [unclassified Flavobacterium]RKR09273.1 hypothetical protein C8C82_1193 [Flavobacterium sp. 81]TCK53056.1 hypothetical protein C8C83_0893 [Flavobacterium sp. 90]